MNNKKIHFASDNVALLIEDKFPKSRRNRDIANKCLSFCEEWALIKKDVIGEISRKQAKKSCKKCVTENLKEEAKGSIFVSFILSLLIKLIISWVIDNYINDLY